MFRTAIGQSFLLGRIPGVNIEQDAHMPKRGLSILNISGKIQTTNTIELSLNTFYKPVALWAQ